MTDQPPREELRRMLQIGRDQIERGDGIEIDERDLERCFAEIEAEMAADLDTLF